MKATIRCRTCNTELSAIMASTPADLHALLESHLVQAHAAHTSCEIECVVDIDAPGRELVIECLQCGNVRTGADIPPYLVGAYVISFHTAHEGHRLRINYGDRVWESPQRK